MTANPSWLDPTKAAESNQPSWLDPTPQGKQRPAWLDAQPHTQPNENHPSQGPVDYSHIDFPAPRQHASFSDPGKGQYLAPVNAAADKFGVPRALMQSIMQIESLGLHDPVHAFNKGSGAQGPFQFMPATAAGYGIDPFDMKQASGAAAKMLSGLAAKYHGDWVLAAAAYNWGGGNVDQWLSGKVSRPPPETIAYMADVKYALEQEHAAQEKARKDAATGNPLQKFGQGVMGQIQRLQGTGVSPFPVAQPHMRPDETPLPSPTAGPAYRAPGIEEQTPMPHSGRLGWLTPANAQASVQGPIGQFALGPLNSAAQALNAWIEPFTLDSPILGGLVRSSGDLNHIKAISADVLHTLSQAKNPSELTSALSAVNDKYGMFTPQNIAALYRDDPHDPVVNYLHHHPTIDDVAARGLANLIMANPASVVRSIAALTRLDKVAAAGSAAAMRVPAVKSVVQGAQRAVNPHALLRQVETDASTPAQREQVGRSFKNAQNRAVHQGVQEVQTDAGLPQGLTKAQRVEIARRSQNQDGQIRNEPNPNVPEPGKGPSPQLFRRQSTTGAEVSPVTGGTFYYNYGFKGIPATSKAHTITAAIRKDAKILDMPGDGPLGEQAGQAFGISTVPEVGASDVPTAARWLVDTGISKNDASRIAAEASRQALTATTANASASAFRLLLHDAAVANKARQMGYDAIRTPAEFLSLTPNATTRASKLPSLDQLAAQHRAWIKQVTAENVAHGRLQAKDVEDVETHLPLRDQPFGTVHTTPEAAPGELSDVGTRGSLGRRSVFGKGVQSTQHRNASGILSDLESAGQLSSRYDPFITSLNYVLPTRLRDEYNRVADAFNRTGMAQDLTYRDTSGNVFGSGEAGQMAAKRVATRDARAQARTETRQQFEQQGIVAPDENMRAMAQARPQAAAARATQAQRDLEASYNRAVADKTAQASADHLFGPGSPAAKKAVEFDRAAKQASFDKERAKLFAKAVNARARQLAGGKFEAFQAKAESEARKAGFTPGSEVAESGVPMASYISVPENVVKFLKNEGASSRDALGAGGMISGFDQLYKMGVITNPIRHVFWNLGMNFLAATGGRGLDFFNPASRDSLWRPADPKWEKLADENNALVYQNVTHPIFGGHDLGTMTQTPMRQVPGEVSQTFGGGARGAAKAVGGTINAAATRAWQANQQITFNLFEHRYSVALLKDMVLRQGVSPEEAGIRVRKALGDYLGVSNTGIDSVAQRVFLFYPWMKTTIPFWARQLTEHPQFVTGPTGDIHRWNEHRGDPNADHEAPGAIYLGTDVNGQPQYASWPGAQKDVVNLLETVSPSQDVNTSPVLNELANHLRPGLAAGYDYLNTKIADDQPPNPAYHIAYQKSAPPGERAQQFAQSEIGRVPFAQLGEHVGKSAFSPMQAVMNLLTINTYSKGGGASGHISARINKEFTSALYKLQAALKNKEMDAREYQIRRLGIHKMQEISSQWAQTYGSLKPDDPKFQESEQQMSGQMQDAENDMNDQLQQAGYNP